MWDGTIFWNFSSLLSQQNSDTAGKYDKTSSEERPVFLLEGLEDERLLPAGGEPLPVELPVGREVAEGQAPEAPLQGQVAL